MSLNRLNCIVTNNPSGSCVAVEGCMAICSIGVVRIVRLATCTAKWRIHTLISLVEFAGKQSQRG